MDREKVIKGLEEMLDDSKYNDSVNWNPWADTEILEDALALLKAQEPRVMTLEELPGWDGTFLIEVRNGATVWANWYAEYEHYGETVCRMVDIGGEVDDRFKKLYGYEWRCWTSRPTDEQREAIPWN